MLGKRIPEIEFNFQPLILSVIVVSSESDLITTAATYQVKPRVDELIEFCENFLIFESPVQFLNVLQG